MPVNVKCIREARASLLNLRTGLDTTSSVCGACGLTKYQQRTEHQMGVELDAILRKLDKWEDAETLRIWNAKEEKRKGVKK